MDNIEQNPPAGEPAQPAPAHPPKRRLIGALVGLHALAMLGACLVIWRGGAGASKGGEVLRSPRKLLSPSKEDSVGWVSIHGPIFESESGRAWDRGMEGWSRKIRQLADKSEVKAIVLDINSPGGSVGAVQELYEVIRRVRQEKKKPVVALLGDIAASGGFYLAAGCDQVVAHPGTLVGSIGVIFNTMNVEGLFAKIGVKASPIKSGKLKDIGSMTRPMTKEERDLLQGLIDDAYGQFFGAVARGRRLKDAELKPLADGRIFTGQQALALRLVDKLGDSKDAVALAGRLGGIAGAPKVTRDVDGLESVLSLLDYGFGALRPEARAVDRLEALSHGGLEYRWTGW